MVEQAPNGPVEALVDAMDRARSLLRRAGPALVRLDVSEDVYHEMVSRALPAHTFLTGGLSPALAAAVVVQSDYPPRTWGATYSDGHQESWSA